MPGWGVAAQFVDELKRQVGLTELEVAIIDMAGVHTYESLYSLVVHFPSLAQHGLNVAKLSNVAATKAAAFVSVAAAALGRPHTPHTTGWVVPAPLLRARPVAISVPVFQDPLALGRDNWNSPAAVGFGEVANPTSFQVVVGGHAVCLVGFSPDPNEPHGGYFTFRNSWGTGWARNAPAGGYVTPAPGHGQISASYLENYLWEAWGL